MTVKSVTKQGICGAKKHGKFTGTGEAKGNFAVLICTKQPGHRGDEHTDQVAGKSWTAR